MPLTEISQSIAAVLTEGRVGHHLQRTWVWKDICAVAEFAYRKITFAFNFVPRKDGLYDLEIVQRSDLAVFAVTANGAKKELVAEALDLASALRFCAEHVVQVVKAIDHKSQARNWRPIFKPSALVAEFARQTQRPLQVGVLTLPMNMNYGGNLQAFALTEVLRQLGHRPILVNRRPPLSDTPPDPAETLRHARRPLIAQDIGFGATAPNRAFLDTRLAPVTRTIHSSEQLAATVALNDFDAFVVGSDQVWRPKYTRSLFTDFFLGFLPESDRKTKRISYAASFGATAWEYQPEHTEKAKHLAARFDAISVREDTAVAQCREHLGVEAQHVLDPTMLLQPQQYMQIFEPMRQRHRGPQLLTYVLDPNKDLRKLVGAVEARFSLTAHTTTGAAFEPREEADPRDIDPSIEGWLAAFANSEFVVTDSFHGMVFSILFNRNFIAYGNPDRGMARFTSLLKLLGLEDRLITRFDPPELARLCTPIDWAPVNARLEELRKSSLAFLVAALSDKPEARGTSPAVAGATPSPMNTLCTGCGVCVSESQGALKMAWTPEGFLVPQAVKETLPPEALRVCPFNPRPEKAVADEDALARAFLPESQGFERRAGRYLKSYVGHSKTFRPSSSSGGLATYVFDQLLKREVVDRLFVVQSDGGAGYRYQMLDRAGDIRALSKTRYHPVTLEGLFDLIDQSEGRVAISGVACFIKAVRLKQHYRPAYREKIPFMVGIICGGLKARTYTDFLAQSAGIKGPYQHPEYRIKDESSTALDYSFAARGADAADAAPQSIRMRRLGDMWGTGLFKSKACDFCTDVLTELAEISLGDAWLPKYHPDGRGSSVVVTRSALADQIIREGMEAGALEMEEVPIATAVQSQSGGVNHKQRGLAFRVWMAEQEPGLPLPAVRGRHLAKVSAAEAVVQLRRERTRAKSLAFWSATEEAGVFLRRMRPRLEQLKAALAARKEGVLTTLGAPLGAEAEVWQAAQKDPVLRWLRREVARGKFDLSSLDAVLLPKSE